MTLQVAYWTVLCALTIIVMFKGSIQMKRTIAAILAAGVASLVLSRLMDWTGTTYALAMMGVDTLAAAVILFRPAGKAQALVGLTLLLQVGFYAGRLLNGADADINIYWWGLSVLAVLQLLLVGGWVVYERVDWRAPVPDRRPAPRPAHRSGLDGR